MKIFPSARPEVWPPEVELILSAMDAARDVDPERRIARRLPYRTRAELRLFSDPPKTPPWILYTRDIDPRGLGFISPHCLPLGYGGWVEGFTPPGGELHEPRTHFPPP